MGAVRDKATEATYDALSDVYDEFEGDRSAQADYLRGLLRERCPSASTLLELACGTGGILRHLSQEYEATGVDSSRRMLDRAATALPNVKLLRQDIRHLALDARFDAVLCVHDSINHLLRYDDWLMVFDRAAAHLSPGGVFLFDINTQQRLRELALGGPFVKRLDQGRCVRIEVDLDPDGEAGSVSTRWTICLLEGPALRGMQRICEASFDHARIVASLEERFERVALRDPERAVPSPETRRLHFVCTQPLR